MLKLRWFFLFILLLLISVPVFTLGSESIFISEIAWMGTLPKEGESAKAAANNEWLELYNPTNEDISLAGWKIVAADGNPEIDLYGTIKAKSYFLLERGNDEVIPQISADIIYPFSTKTSSLANSGEHLFLKDAQGNVVDEIDASGGWPAGDNTTKDTMQKTNQGWITAPSTPRSPLQKTSSVQLTESQDAQPRNDLVQNSSDNLQDTQNGSTTENNSAAVPRLEVFAGQDITAVAGQNVEFSGYAFGLNREPLSNARYFWNFGDGQTFEGRSTIHSFSLPGRYTVGLYVSAGEYTGADYLEVEVKENNIRIADFMEGGDGFVSLENPMDFAVDIGGWLIKDGSGNKFFIPAKTIIGKKALISFANQITKLSAVLPIYLYYPNMRLAYVLRESNLQDDAAMANGSGGGDNNLEGIAKQAGRQQALKKKTADDSIAYPTVIQKNALNASAAELSSLSRQADLNKPKSAAEEFSAQTKLNLPANALPLKSTAPPAEKQSKDWSNNKLGAKQASAEGGKSKPADNVAFLAKGLSAGSSYLVWLASALVINLLAAVGFVFVRKWTNTGNS